MELLLINGGFLFLLTIVSFLWASFAHSVSKSSCFSSCGDEDTKKKVTNSQNLSFWLCLLSAFMSIGSFGAWVYFKRKGATAPNPLPDSSGN